MFEGKVIQVSHERGLLVSFEGSSPALGSTIVDNSGNVLGRVETVLGNINEPLVHIHPIKSGVVINDCIGKNVKIRSRNKNDSRDSFRKRDSGRGNDRRGNDRRGSFRTRDGGRNNARRGNDRRGSDRNVNLKPGDWRCPKCNNHNYASKQVCNRTNCNEKKPRGNNRGRDNNRRNSSNQKRNSNRRTSPKPNKHFKDRSLKNVFSKKE